mmetsp:Transcript_44833/g.144303  ORF Transcript_44833/g.144303 Transcript_44833/m.144303 type:complete len:349 (+) Transcript_44833:306-1352(+)
MPVPHSPSFPAQLHSRGRGAGTPPLPPPRRHRPARPGLAALSLASLLNARLLRLQLRAPLPLGLLGLHLGRLDQVLHRRLQLADGPLCHRQLLLEGRVRCPVALARLGQLLLDVGQLLLGLAKLGGERGNHARRLLCRIQPGRLLRDRSGVSSLVKIFAGAHLRRRVDIARRRKPRLRLLLLLAQTPPLECIGRAAPWVAGPQVERVARGRARVLEARKDRLAALLHVGLVWLFEPLPPPLRRVGRAAPRVEGVARRVGRQMTFHGAVGVAGLRLRQPLPPPLLRRGRAVAPLRVPCPELGRPGVGLQGWAGGPGQRCDPVCWRQPCREAGAVKRGEKEHCAGGAVAE